jgi:hypothetical protein
MRLDIPEQFKPFTNQLIDLGFSILVRPIDGGKLVIRWTTPTSWSSASFHLDSEADINRVIGRLTEGIYNERSKMNVGTIQTPETKIDKQAKSQLQLFYPHYPKAQNQINERNEYPQRH